MKVFVGMSGGVDSSLTAALLVEQGHEVTGVYMKNWTQDLPGMKCPWADDLADAKRVAVQLGIDFVVYDFESEYRDKVVRYMIDEYQRGRTPNPDVMCNQEVKFKLFLETALENGADKIATGHYARTEGGKLLKAVDEKKDQTYFLYRVTQAALEKTLFPLGGYTKPEVRAMAEARGLTTAHKKDSQGICFVGQIGIRDFLSQYVDVQPGDVIDKSSGEKLGRHEGAIFYTLGQRHGIHIGGGLPYYVSSKDMSKNEVYVTTKIHDDSLWLSTIELINAHWINQAPKDGEIYHVRIRHGATPIECVFENNSLKLREPQRAVTPGQSAVLYSGKHCLGGGIVS
jgi:tRNA-uridine 2-sulfurtransferase